MILLLSIVRFPAITISGKSAHGTRPCQHLLRVIMGIRSRHMNRMKRASAAEQSLSMHITTITPVPKLCLVLEQQRMQIRKLIRSSIQKMQTVFPKIQTTSSFLPGRHLLLLTGREEEDFMHRRGVRPPIRMDPLRRQTLDATTMCLLKSLRRPK